MSRIKLIVNNLYPKDLYVSYSLLILRVIASVMMIINHGWNKILAGQEKWNRLGTALTDFIGIDFMSVFFGFMAAFSESIDAVTHLPEESLVKIASKDVSLFTSKVP